MKVIAIAHDPGGANAVAATVETLRSTQTAVEAYAKGPAIRQFQRLGVPCTPVSGEHQALFSRLNGDVLVTGTSQSDRFERDAILWAKQQGIPSIALIDYWANYRQRFQASDVPNAELILPDLITAIDEECAREMMEDGLPESRIRVVGQPYFSWLIERKKPLKQQVQLPQFLFFASQPNANEVEILQTLIEVLSDYKPLKQLLVRFHPRQGQCPASLKLLERSGLPFAIDESTDVLSTLRQQDCVLGITSTILIEAAFMGIPVGSIVIGVNDTLATNQWRLTIPLSSSRQIRLFLQDLKQNNDNPGKKFIEQHKFARENIYQLCK